MGLVNASRILDIRDVDVCICLWNVLFSLRWYQQSDQTPVWKTRGLMRVWVTEQHYVSISSSLVHGLCAKLRFSGTWVDWWLINKNVVILLFSLHFCLSFGFVFIRMRSLRFLQVLTTLATPPQTKYYISW